MTFTKGKSFWIGKAPRPDLMDVTAPGGAVQGKGRNFWEGKAPRLDLMPAQKGGAAVQGKGLATGSQGGERNRVPRPDLLPAAMRRPALQGKGLEAEATGRRLADEMGTGWKAGRGYSVKNSEARMFDGIQLAEMSWEKKLPEAVGIGNDWRLDRVISKPDQIEYEQYLRSWSSYAKTQMKISEETYDEQRSSISEKQCTPATWTKAEETACVCDDLIDALEEADDEVQYIIYYRDEAIGAITLRDGYHLIKTDKSEAGFNITGLVKKMDAQGGLGACIPKFLSILLKRTNKTGIDVASAKGAVGAYVKYGFTNTNTDAGHYGHICGCTVLHLKA